MRCPRCAAEIPRGARECPYCGAPLDGTQVRGVVTHPAVADPDSDEESPAPRAAVPGRMGTLTRNVLAREVAPRRSGKVRHAEDKPLDGQRRPRKHRRVWYWALLAALFVVLAVAGAVAAGSYALELWGGKSVPSVIGETQARATDAIQAKGLQVEVESRPSDSGDGHVLECDPPAGSRVQEGGTVKLVVSANRVVPDVTGLSLDEARSALSDQGAQNVHVVYDSSNDEPESTVLGVNPQAGSVFMADDQITLTVAQAPVVPDVVGKTEADAIAALGKAALTGRVVYVGGTEAQRGTVVSTSPAAGATAGDDGVVQLNVANPNPTDYRHLLEYFSCSTNTLPAWLENQGFSLQVGYKAGSDRAFESFENDAGDTVGFTSQPWAALGQKEGSEPQDVLTPGAFYDGLRLTIPESESPETGATQVTAKTIADACGFGDASDSCTQADITSANALKAPKANFYCASGESGTYVWTVLVRSTTGSKTEAVCTAAPKELYESQDLSGYGNSICDFVAYQEMY